MFFLVRSAIINSTSRAPLFCVGCSAPSEHLINAPGTARSSLFHGVAAVSTTKQQHQQQQSEQSARDFRPSVVLWYRRFDDGLEPEASACL